MGVCQEQTIKQARARTRTENKKQETKKRTTGVTTGEKEENGTKNKHPPPASELLPEKLPERDSVAASEARPKSFWMQSRIELRNCGRERKEKEERKKETRAPSEELELAVGALLD